MTDHKTETGEEWLAAGLELLEGGGQLGTVNTGYLATSATTRPASGCGGTTSTRANETADTQRERTIVSDYNSQIIDEFRANEGRVGGMWEGTPMVLLHHTGAKSGKRRVTPVAYLSDGGRYVVIASNGGAPTS